MAARQTLNQKIQELFAYRHIPELLRMGGIEQDSPFVSRLYKLQEAIYGLDQYLEKQWSLNKQERKMHWDAIYFALEGFGIEKGKAGKYVKTIKQYEEFERNIHKHKLPSGQSLKRSYVAKSCDVTLIRQLIYRHAPDLKKEINLKDWASFDLISEINDDIHDVYEDCETINGNRFIIALLLTGKRRTRRAFKRLLEKAGEQARAHFKSTKKDYPVQLYSWTRQRLRETEELLRVTLDDQKLKLVEHSILADKLFSGKKKHKA